MTRSNGPEALHLNIDMDETLCRLMPGDYGWLAWLKENHKIELEYHQLTDYNIGRLTGLGNAAYGYLDTPECFLHNEPMPGAIEALTDLSSDGHIITFVTSCRNRGDNKREWLRRHIGEKFKYGLVLVENSDHKGRFHGDVLLDDHVENLAAFNIRQEVSKNHMTKAAVCFAHPWNTHWEGRHRVADWAEFVEFVERLVR